MATEQTIFQYTLNLTTVTDVMVLVSGKHVYANIAGNKPWQLAIYIDGVLRNYAGGSGYGTDAPQVLAFLMQASAGSHTVRITWFGHNSMQLRGVNAIIQGLRR